jgi:NAD(P)-dependent dehydrogenase (short-subunit alcohol dehydrogenase family)
MPFAITLKSNPRISSSQASALVRRSVLITGASSGIGKATLLRLARRGWRVFAAVRKEADAKAIGAEGITNVETVLLDVIDKRSIQCAAADIGARLERSGLDGLFNNAGIGIISPVESVSPEELRHVFEVNVFGQIDVIQAFLPLIRKAKGRIINSGSVGDHITPPFGGALAGSKAAFASMTAALRLELRSQGIRVCLIEPGSINTPAGEKTLGGPEKTISNWAPAARELYADPFRRMTETFSKNERNGSPPEDVARVVERALTARNPGTRYPAGKDAVKLAMLGKFLPEKLLDRAILRTFGLPTTFGKPSNKGKGEDDHAHAIR